MAEGLRRFKKKNLASAQGLADYLARPQPPARPPAAMLGRYNIRERRVAGFTTYRVSPLDQPPRGGLLYVHGGAYVAEITRQHWVFVARLVDQLGWTVEVPIYGLAPAYTYRDAFPLITHCYRDLLAGHPTGPVALAGDSCGGGMVLALAQTLEQQRLPQPAAIVLLSPWLDLTLSNPEIAETEALDPWLSVAGLVAAGRHWAGGDDPAAPLTSPVNGPLSGLAPVSTFVGTHDLVLADCRRLRSRAQAAGLPLRHVEYPAMFHAWMLSAIPEADHATQQILAHLDPVAGRTG